MWLLGKLGSNYFFLPEIPLLCQPVEFSPGSLDPEELHLHDDRLVRPDDLAAPGPFSVSELGRAEELPLGANRHEL